MAKTSEYDAKKRMARMIVFSRNWWYAPALLAIMAVTAHATAEEQRRGPTILPPQELAVKVNAYILMGEFEISMASCYAHWPDEARTRDRWLAGAKKADSVLESLDRTLGPVEILETETLDRATRVVVPILSGKIRNRDTGEIRTVTDYSRLILEKQNTGDEPQWRIISSFDPRRAELKTTWLPLPRKKVPGSPTIVLKKAVVVQTISENKMVNEKRIFADANEARSDQPQEVAVQSYAYHLLGRIAESLLFSPEWPEKDKYMEASKKWRERYENLEYTFGPIEIRENETWEKATRAVLPTVSMSLRKLSTGEIIRLPHPGVPKIAATVLEKRDTPTGPRWYIISEGPGCAELESSGWLKLPRKKVPDAPTIIMRKAVVVQVVSNDQVVNERVICADPNSR
jgi:hypothetical protein